MNDISPGLGHNRPPIKELLQEAIDKITELLPGETAELAEKAQEYIICADERSEVVDAESAQKAVQLEATMIEIYQDLEKLRMAIKRPVLDGTTAIDFHFYQITHPLIGPSPTKKREGAIGDLHSRIEAFDQRQRAEIEAEKARLEAGARAQQEAAEQAERERQAALEQAKAAPDPQAQAAAFRRATEAGHARQRLADEAAKTLASAATQVARPIDSGVGPKAVRRSNWQPQITDLPAAVAHCLRIPQVRTQIDLLVQRAYGALIRAGARDTFDAEGKIVPGLPGALIIDQTKLTVRRK